MARRVAGTALVVLPGAAMAQGGPEGFLLGAPQASLTLRGGYGAAGANGGVFDLVTRQLTLGRGDFSSPSVGADLGIRLAPHVDLLISGSFMQSSSGSEFREFVRDNDSPITQTTRFRRVPLQVGARLWLLPPGRSVGRLAWLPNKIAPWIGATGGATWYRFDQDGDFVDNRTFDIFPREFRSSAWGGSAQVMGGVDVSLSPRLALTTDVRYLTGSAAMRNDFASFRTIDLSGYSANVGLTIRM